MSMHNDPSLSKQIWEGQPEALIKARKRYEADPTTQLVPWISTLYSCREHEECRAELRPLLEPIVQHLWRKGDQEFDRFTSDELDVLSTVLLWAADAFRPSLEEVYDFSFEALDVADVMAHLGRKRTRKKPDGSHTYELLTLTYAAIQVRQGRIQEALCLLAEVQERVSAIHDPNQKARVYRKLGALYLKTGNPFGSWFIARALLVKGAASGTRKKTLFFWRR